MSKEHEPHSGEAVRCSTVVSCHRCIARGKTWSGDEPKCAFRDGIFTTDNWNCATANALREIVPADNWNNNDDQHACLITGSESLHVLLTWYKSRGRTEGAWMIECDGKIKPLTIEEAERVIAASHSNRSGLETRKQKG